MTGPAIDHDAGFAQAALAELVKADVRAILVECGFDYREDEVETIAISLRRWMVGRVDDEGLPYAEFETDGRLTPEAVGFIVTRPGHPAAGMLARRAARDAEYEAEEWAPPPLPEAIQQRLRGLPPDLPPDDFDY